MKGFGRYLLGAAVLTVLGGLCLIANQSEKQIVSAQEGLILGNAGPETSLDNAERYFEYASYLPWVGSGPLNHVRARKAAREYWRQEYAALIPAQETDPVAAVDPDNIELQLVVANAVFRAGQAGATGRPAVRQLLNKGIEGYATVLRNVKSEDQAPYAQAAAYNYEFLVRQRSELDKGRPLPPVIARDSRGAPGQPESNNPENDFKLYVPLDQKERQGGDAAKAGPRARKG